MSGPKEELYSDATLDELGTTLERVISSGASPNSDSLTFYSWCLDTLKENAASRVQDLRALERKTAISIGYAAAVLAASLEVSDQRGTPLMFLAGLTLLLASVCGWCALVVGRSSAINDAALLDSIHDDLRCCSPIEVRWNLARSLYTTNRGLQSEAVAKGRYVAWVQALALLSGQLSLTSAAAALYTA